MSSTIDKRVVEMRFDNQQFETNAGATMGTLEKLKNALNFKNAGSGLDNLNQKVKGTNFSPLSSAVESVQVKFSAMEIAAVTALTNIVNRAVDTGIQLVKSLSIDQISAGFSEYELKMGSIQTIMAGTGESLETVNQKLDELNTYADKTIYSFSDMTSNIGKFTNAGVKLDDAVSAIQGVSNVAAVSGANANEASRAMYNFAQALSAGYVKLIDWKSIENANMATVEFKQQLLDTALAMGTVRKEGDKYVTTTTDAKGAVSDAFDATSMFNDSLSHQWMTTDVLVQALSNYSTDIREMSAEEVKAYEEKLRAIGYTEDQIKAIEELGKKAFDSAQDVKTFSQLMDTLKESVGSGWAQTFEIIFGDFEEAKALWTSVNEVVGAILQKQADSRNEMLKEWKAMGGREMLMGALSDAYREFLKIASPVKRAFENIFPPITAQRLMDMTAQFRKFIRSLSVSPRTTLKLQQSFEGLFSIFGLFGDIIREVASFLKDLLMPGLSDGAGEVLEFTADLGQNIKAFRNWIKQNNIIRKGLEAIKSAVSKGLTTLKNWFNTFKELPWVQEWTEKIKTKFNELTQTIRSKFPNAAKKFDELVAAIKNLWKSKDFSKISGPIKEFASALKDDLLAAWEKVKSSELFTKFVDSMKAIWESIKNIDTKKISGWMKTTYESIKEFLRPAVDLFKKIKDKLFGYATSVRDGTMSIADALRDGATWIKEHIGSIIAALAIFITARTVVKFISKIWKVAEALAAPVTTIVDAFNGFAQAAKGLKSVLKATALLEAALAIGGLVLIVVEVGKADGAQIAKGLAVVGLVSLFVAGVIAALGYMFKHKSTLSPKSVKSQIAGMFKMIELAGAVMLLVAAFGDLTDTISKCKNDPKTLKIALYGIVGSIVVLVGITYVLKKIGPVDTKGISAPILSIAAAVYILVQAFSDIIAAITAEGVTTEDVERATATLLSLTGLMGGIAILLAAISKIPTSGSSLKIGGGVFAVALSVKVLVGALDDIMNLDFEKIKGSKDTLVALAAIAGTLVLLMVAISKMPATAGMNGVGLFAAAASIEILAIAVKTMSSLDAGDIARGVIAIGAMLIFLGIFTKLTSAGTKLNGKSAAATFLGLSVAILILSAAIVALSFLKEEDVIIGTAAISALLISMGIMLKLATKALRLKIAPFIGIVFIVGALTGAIVALSSLDESAVIIGTLALSALMICVGFMAGLMSVCDNLKLGSFVGLSLIILALAVSIRMIAELEEGVAKAVVAMGVMMVLFGLLSKMLSTAAVNFNEAGPLGLVGVGICILVLAACAGVVAALVSLGDVDSVVAIALSLGVLMAAVGIAMQGVAAVGQLGEGGGGWEKLGIGLVGLVAVIGVIALLIAGVVALNEYVPGAKEAIDKALPLFNSIGKALGEVVGGFLEGLFGIDTSGLTQQITEFGDGMKNFADSASGISDEAANGVKAIAAMLLALAGSDLMNAITGLLGGKVTTLTEFSAQLPGFGADMAAFAKALGTDFKPEIVEGAGEAGKSLATMVRNLPTTGGWKEKILGTPESMESFSSSVMTFATLLKDLSSEENGIGGLTQTDINKIELLASAGEKLIDLQGKLPASGGFLQTILGEQTTLDTFGGQLVSFAGAVRKLASPVVGFGKFTKDDVDHMGYAADAAGKLVELQTALPDEEGWLSKFFGGGQQDLESFGEDAVAFAGSLKKVLSEDEGFGGLSDTSKDCIDIVSDVVNALKGFIAANEGEEAFDSSGIKTLGEDIKSFGKNFNTFYDYIDDIDATFLTSIVSEITNLVNTLSSGLDGTSVSTFSDSLSTLASTGITNFCNEFTNSNTQLILAIGTFMDVAIAAINANDTVFSDAGKSSISSYVDEFDKAKEDARREARDFISALSNVFSEAKTIFNGHGKTLVTNYIDGIRAESETNTIDIAINGLVTKAMTPLASAKDTALIHGRSFSEKFVNGIKFDVNGNWNQQNAYDAASAIASWATSALGNMYNSGEVQGHNFSIGFINGIYYDVYKRSYTQQAFDAAYKIGDSAVKGLRTGINAHSPSRESQAAADDFGIGFTARLMSKWAKNAGEAGGELGSEAVDSLNEAIRKIPDMLAGDIDMSPIITPTIDLTNARASADLLNAMFNQSVKTSASMANITGASINSASKYASAYADQQNAQAQAPSLNVENHNQFNITSDNPTEVANRVSYVLQKQVERKESVWARSSGMGSPRVRFR